MASRIRFFPNRDSFGVSDQLKVRCSFRWFRCRTTTFGCWGYFPLANLLLDDTGNMWIFFPLDSVDGGAMPTAEWCAEAERDVSQFTGDSSIHRGTSHFHRRFRNDFWCQRGTGSLLLHLFARFVCQFWYTYYIILLIYIYIHTYTLVNLLWQRFFGEVYEYRGNFMGQFLRSAGLTCCSVNGDSVSRCTQVIPVGDGNTGGASWKRFGDPGPHIFLGTEASKTEPL